MKQHFINAKMMLIMHGDVMKWCSEGNCSAIKYVRSETQLHTPL